MAISSDVGGLFLCLEKIFLLFLKYTPTKTASKSPYGEQEITRLREKIDGLF